MTRLIDHIADIGATFDLALVDQWGVLHDGEQVFAPAVDALRALAAAGKALVVLSNSGKRAAANRVRLARMGVPMQLVAAVVSSGEVLWQAFAADGVTVAGVTPRRVLAIAREAGDVAAWFEGLASPQPVQRIEDADAILLLGLPDEADLDDYDALVHAGLARRLPLICANPDKRAPRGAHMVVSSGALAARYAEAGGAVLQVGKPFPVIFEAVVRRFAPVPPARMLMIGDSLEHDIAGAAQAGLATLLVLGGVHRDAFRSLDAASALRRLDELVRTHGCARPDYAMPLLR